jgi:tetratricopeptide (TPR) repeat protein
MQPRALGRRLAASLLVLTLAACAGNAPPPPPEPVEADLMSGWRLARAAFERGQYEQAVALYDKVLSEAYARDDLGAIADVGYELAVVRLRAGQHADAAAEAERVRTELRRRGREPLAELHLVEAVALYGAGNPDGALSAAAAAIERAGPDDALLVGRAEYVRGAVAADRNDADDLKAAIGRLGRPVGAEPRADWLELVGRLELIEGEPASALPRFEESADLRRQVGDYFGMARALAFAAQAAAADGRKREAADLYFRAGRSADIEGRDTDAQQWLQEAVRFAKDTGQRQIERDAEQILERM